MTTHIDPVCGMQVNEQNAAGWSAHQGKTFYFCSESCKKQFDQDPESYVQTEPREPVA
jgi:P-type Cu+ transporter